MSGETAEIPGLNNGINSFSLPNYRGHSAPNPNGTAHPNVLMGAGDFAVKNTVLRAGALSAVGGYQKIRIKRPRPSRHVPAPADSESFNTTGDYPSVLPGFNGTIPAATYGIASFSAVGGNQTLRPTSGPDIPNATMSRSQMNVLPNSDGNFPRPNGGRFDDGSYSAVAGYQQQFQGDPSVLRDFRHFEANNVRLLPGAFAAVGLDQTVVYNDESGEEVDENVD